MKGGKQRVVSYYDGSENRISGGAIVLDSFLVCHPTLEEDTKRGRDCSPFRYQLKWSTSLGGLPTDRN